MSANFSSTGTQCSPCRSEELNLLMLNGWDWKDRLQEKPQFGCFVTFPSAALAEYTALMGFDFLLIDNEHGAIDQGVQEDMIRASHCTGTPVVVRVPRNRPEYIQKALDNGANGVQIPLTDTVQAVEHAVQSSRFPPLGNRGVAFLPRAARYGLYPDKAEYIKRANLKTVISVHIETVEAVKNLDSILEVEGADVLFVGPGDLAVSMGYANDPNHSDVLRTIERCIRNIRARGKIAGTYVGTAERAKQAIDWGAAYLVTSITPAMAHWAHSYLQAVKKG